jgi:uncharacterized membrane protein YccC
LRDHPNYPEKEVKIKTQEALMNAIKAVLDAEDQLAAVSGMIVPKGARRAKVRELANKIETARNMLSAARTDLRRAYKEAHNESTT